MHESIERGWGNGYVSLPASHPWFGVSYKDIPASIHGGLTYSQEEMPGWWTIGFDTAHYMDTKETWTKEAVHAEAVRLLEQVLAANQQ